MAKFGIMSVILAATIAVASMVAVAPLRRMNISFEDIDWEGAAV